MNNKTGFNRLSRTTSHRKALMRNLVKSLFEHEQIKTTKAKAKEVARKAEKMITKAKVDSVHARRLVARDLNDRTLVKKLFTEIAPRYAGRPGGYTRVVKMGFRQGDAAELAIIELVDRKGTTEEATKKEEPKAKKAAPKKTEAAVKEKAPAKKVEAAKDDTAE
ncbi:MAG: 50S ribosomal protein L17 [Spirochaetaceae bacterium]|nr:50S ribosomal protein L17 [Spirochaetaceae bacterium]